MEKSTVRIKITRPERHLSLPEAATTTRIGRVAAGSWSFPKLPVSQKNKSPKVAPKKQHGTESENTCNYPIFDTFGRYIWKAIAPRSKHSGTPKLELEVRRVCTIDGNPHPLPEIYRYGASASDYTCRPNIHYLLYR